MNETTCAYVSCEACNCAPDEACPILLAEFKEFCTDGWPLCPRCENDELQNAWFSAQASTGPRATIERFINAGLTCLFCGWRSLAYRRHA